MSNVIRFLFPSPVERRIARRYLYTKSVRSRPTSLLLPLLLGVACLIVESSYFAFGYRTPLMAISAMLVPLFFSISILLRVFSVFSTVAISGVAVGVGSLIVVLSVASGFIEQVSSKFSGVMGDLILDQRNFLDAEEYPQLLKTLRSHPAVESASTFVDKNPLFLSKMDWPPIGVWMRGVDLSDPHAQQRFAPFLVSEKQHPLQLSTLGQEQVPNQGGPPLPAIFLGDGLVRQLNLKKGDKVLLLNVAALVSVPLGDLDISSQDEGGNQPTANLSPPSQEFYLAGVIHTGYEKFDRKLVLTSLKNAQLMSGMGDIVQGIEIHLYQPSQAKQVQQQLKAILGSYPIHPPPSNQVEALRIQKTALSLVIFLIILVAAFNVIASLSILVINKTQGIAILKTMGVPPWGVAAIFRVVGTTIGLLGAFLGVSLGLIFCMVVKYLNYALEARIYLVDHIPVTLSVQEIVGAAVATILLCTLSTLYPALRAAHLHPVDGIRQE